MWSGQGCGRVAGCCSGWTARYLRGAWARVTGGRMEHHYITIWPCPPNSTAPISCAQAHKAMSPHPLGKIRGGTLTPTYFNMDRMALQDESMVHCERGWSCYDSKPGLSSLKEDEPPEWVPESSSKTGV